MKYSFSIFVFLACTFLSSGDETTTPHQETTPHQDQFYRPPDPAVVKKNLDKLFDDRLDENKDGYLTADELKVWIKVMHEEAIHTNIDRQWEYFDKELTEIRPGVKALAWENYKKITFPERDHEEKHEEGYNPKEMEEKTERRWKMADADKDGSLDKNEFKNFLHPEESPEASDIIIIEATEMMDKDKSGDVSLEEYMEHLKKVSGPEKHETGWDTMQQGHFTNFLDKDKDGILNKNEMREWVLPTYDRNEGEAWRLISMVDSDRDTRITKDDILHNHEQFLGILPQEFWLQEGNAGSVKHDEF